jgi:polysaccharide deacetylase family protein (PEP-CTERM system associated)
VTGYRAPTFSVGPRRTPWAHAVLAETGHRYSSSIFPGRHEGAGVPGTPLTPWRPDPRGVVEIPMTAWRPPLLGRDLPVSGGGWFRLTPYPAFAAALRRVNQAGRRGVFYLHPWELDPQQPRVAGMPAVRRLKHFTGLATAEARLARLLSDFNWGRMDEVFAAEIEGRAATRPALAAAE